MHRNRPDPSTGLSSSKEIFGRKIRNLLPFSTRKLTIRPKWHKLMEQVIG